MADRTSARIFSQIFTLLAKDPTDEHKEIAKEIWELSCECDFSPPQMDADEACIALGIAIKGIDYDYPESGFVTLWLDSESDIYRL